MTTPKEALELKPCPFCGSRDVEAVDSLDFVACQNCGASLEDSEPSARELWNTRATVSLQGEDAVERVARTIVGPRLAVPDNCQFTLEELRSVRWSQSTKAEQQDALNAARAILATGLVPDEAAIRADEREKCAARFRGKDIWTGEAIAAAIRSGGGE